MEVTTHEQPCKTPTYLGFTASAAAPSRLLHPSHWRAFAIGRACLWNCRPQRSCSGRGQLRFLGSDLHDYSLAFSSSSSRLVYLFVGHAPRVIAFNVNSVKLIIIFNWSSSSRNRTSHIVSAFKLYLTYLMCWSIYAWVCYIICSAGSLIWYALIMFIIYPWIKIRLKMLNFPTCIGGGPSSVPGFECFFLVAIPPERIFPGCPKFFKL
jgi:hypothetical protein